MFLILQNDNYENIHDKINVVNCHGKTLAFQYLNYDQITTT